MGLIINTIERIFIYVYAGRSAKERTFEYEVQLFKIGLFVLHNFYVFELLCLIFVILGGDLLNEYFFTHYYVNTLGEVYGGGAGNYVCVSGYLAIDVVNYNITAI